jgi:hypothetical protein
MILLDDLLSICPFVKDPSNLQDPIENHVGLVIGLAHCKAETTQQVNGTRNPHDFCFLSGKF